MNQLKMPIESVLDATGSIAADHCNVLEECLKELDEKYGENEIDQRYWDRVEGEMRMFHSKNAIRIHELLRMIRRHTWWGDAQAEVRDCRLYLTSIGFKKCPRDKSSLKQLLNYVETFKSKYKRR